MDPNLSPQQRFQEELERFQKDVNFILDDIIQAHYITNQEEKGLLERLAREYNVYDAKRLLEVISSKHPFNRVNDTFQNLANILGSLYGLIDKIHAMDRINQRSRQTMASHLRDSFDGEYEGTVEDTIEVCQKLVMLDDFFRTFCSKKMNERILKPKRFNCKNLGVIVVKVKSILKTWGDTDEGGDNSRSPEIYLKTLNEIRNIPLEMVGQVINHPKSLKKKIKDIYPASKLWYAKKYYYGYLYELIEILENYQEFIDTGGANLNKFNDQLEASEKRMAKLGSMFRRTNYVRI